MNTQSDNPNPQLPATTAASQHQPVRRRAATMAAAQVDVPATPAEQFNLLKVVHSSLRGRYHWAILLGLVTAGLCGAAGWKLARPLYKSQGLVRIAYTLPAVMTETDQNRAMGNMFDTFMTSQTMLISSHRVVESAVQDPIWKAMGRQVPADPDRFFAKGLTVATKHGSEYIQIAVTDYDPALAAAAVTAVINAYQTLYNEQDHQLERQRLGVLQDNQGSFNTQINQLQEQIRIKSQEYGTIDLSQFYTAAAARVTKLEAALEDVRLAISAAPHDAAAQNDASANASPNNPTKKEKPVPLTPEQIAGSGDATMNAYLNERNRLEGQLKQLLMRLGPAHEQVKSVQLSLSDNADHIQKYAEQYREFHAVTAQGLGDPYNRTVITAGRSLEQLQENEISLVKLLTTARKDMVELGNKGQELNRLQEQLRSAREEYEKLTKRIEVLRAEGALGGRLSVVGSPEIPISPETDPRLKLAPARALAGLCLPAALMVLLSLARRRYRYSDDAQSAGSLSAPLLGILPELNVNNSDAKQALAAAHSIHQIRVSLRAEEKQAGPHVYLVTSAAAGEGKTSLTMSLGLSFAASQLRTLIVDGDFVGQHLSNNLKARELEGLSEALTAGTLHKLVRKTQGGLCVLTAGRTTGAAACAMRTDSIHSVLSEARRYFDVVLVDSGPILGSLEAAVLAPEVDGVIFTISRGQQRSTVESATRRIRSLGGRVVGYVFNRANPQDFDSSPYASSSRLSAGVDDGDASILSDLETIATPFGPLVRAVAAGVPTMQN